MGCLCKNKELVKFFKENQNPNDDDVHNWAKQKGIDVHELETQIYRMATKFSKLMMGGRFSKSESELADFDMHQVKSGIGVELEHTSDTIVAKKIALDHLVEHDNYYIALKLMEQYLTKNKKNFSEKELKKQLGL